MKTITLIALTIAISCSSFAQTITTIAGNGSFGYSGDSGPATAASLNNPAHIAIDASGNIFFTDYHNNAIRKISTSGIITTVAGTGYPGYSGDGFAATTATLDGPNDIAIDATGNLFIADQYNYVIRKIDVSGIITTIAGNGIGGYSGDGMPALSAEMLPAGVAVDNAGNIYISDYGNQRIRKVNTSGIISTIAGTGYPGYSGDGGAAIAADIFQPCSLTVDDSGNVYFPDQLNDVVRRISTAGIINTVAGNGTMGYSGDGFIATSASFYYPSETKVDHMGNLYIVDAYNNVVRVVNTDGIINTFAGTGTPGYTGNGGPAASAELQQPWGVSLDACGNVFITDALNDVIRKVTLSSSLPPITGPTSVSVGTTIDLYDLVSGGIWSSSNPAIAIIGTSGIVTGESAGGTTITYSNYCGSAIYRVGVNASTTVENVQSETMLKVMPNPNNGSFLLKGRLTEGNSYTNAKIEIMDMLGHICYSAPIQLDNGIIDHGIVLSNKPNGIYIVKITIGTTIQTLNVTLDK